LPERRLLTQGALADSLSVSAHVAAVLLDVLSCTSSDQPPPLPGAPEGCCADAHHCLLLLFVNTYARPHAQSTLRTAGDAWPSLDGGWGGAGSPSSRSGSLSPVKPGCARHARSHGAGDDEELQRAFVLRHLSTLLPLLRSTPAAGAAATDAVLSAAEFDRIGFLFELVGQPASARLSDASHAFAGGVQKSITLSAARDWLVSACRPPPPPGAPLPSGDWALEGAQRCTHVLRASDVSPDGCLRLVDCSDVTLYVLAPVALAMLSGCSDCCVLLGAASRCLRLDSCSRCSLTAAARCVQLRGVHGGLLSLATLRPTLVLGDTRGVRLAPHNASYDALPRHLARAGLAPEHLAVANRWAEAVALDRSAHAAQLAPQPAEDFSLCCVPFSAQPPGGAEKPPHLPEASPVPLPALYAAAMRAKVERVAAVQAAVQEAQLGEEKRRELQAAIQSHFQTWLSAQGHLRVISDLSRLA
jgi:TBCC domain-containing protein 1